MCTDHLSIEQKIAKARIAGLIRAVAAAENRVALAAAKGKDAGPHEREARALRAELARVLAVAEASAYMAPEQIAHRDLKPENVSEAEDAGAAAEAVLPRRDPRIEELRRELATAEEAPALRWPGDADAGSPLVAQAPPGGPDRATVQATVVPLRTRPAAGAAR